MFLYSYNINFFQFGYTARHILYIQNSTAVKNQHTFGGLFGPGGEAVEMEGSPADLTVPDPVRGTDHIPADHAVISRVSQTNCQSFHESTIFFDLVHKGSRCARPI